IGYFTDMAGSNHTVWNDATTAINQMDVNLISENYVKYIGAGMMLCGGIIGAIKLIPIIISSIEETLRVRSSRSLERERSSTGIIILLSGILTGLIVSFIISKNMMMAIVGLMISFIL